MNAFLTAYFLFKTPLLVCTCVPYCDIIGFENTNLEQEINQILDIVLHLNALIVRAKKGRKYVVHEYIQNRISSTHITMVEVCLDSNR